MTDTQNEFIAVLDTETSSLEPATGHLLEWAVALWHIPTASMMQCASYMCQGQENAAMEVNGISPHLLVKAAPFKAERLRAWVSQAHCALAWNADFDRGWLPDLGVPMLCAMDDFTWPKKSHAKSLVDTALAHGLGVSSAHRAIDDVLLLCSLLTRAAELGNIESIIAQAKQPRFLYRALVKFTDNQLVKDAGFKWARESKEWLRKLRPEDVGGLPFRCEIVK